MLTVTSARYTDEAATQVAVIIDGDEWQGIAFGVDAMGISATPTTPGVIGAGPVHDALRTWIAAGNAITAWAPPAVASVRALRIEAAWAECERRIDAGSAQVATSAGTHSYGLDRETRENIAGINALIEKERGGLLPAGTVPSPRPWWPKGATAPVQLTHADFALVGAALVASKDTIMQAYFAHKAALLGLNDRSAIIAYDITAGWPA